ncbi:leucine-rich_repeat domain-containing protein [Hexamita inflata]|uniref:Leucine-rich repeat domain-containing protein n=1 Tax=Hexamita inflata TaxID=28002 RepID=A0AA86PCM5_9EUKA|nr:leucine-rich repeat domain-containing protein [Hexamita inflata]
MQFASNKIRNQSLIIRNEPLDQIKFVEELPINKLILKFCSRLYFNQVPNNIKVLIIESNYCQTELTGIKQMKQLNILTIRNAWARNVKEAFQLNLTELDLTNNGINDVQGLQLMKSLRILCLKKNQMGHQIQVIYNLLSLVKLDISETHTTNISGIHVLKELQELRVSSNYIYDFSALKQMNLVALEASNNHIVDISFLKHMKQLQILNLNKNKIESVDDLKFLVNITRLYLNSNNIENIMCLSKLKDLRELHLFNNRIVDISVVRNFRKLVILDVSKNKVINTDALKNLYIVKLNVSHNYIHDFSPLQYHTYANTFHYKLFKQQQASTTVQYQSKCIKCVNCSQLTLIDSVSRKICLKSSKKEFELKVVMLNTKFCGTIVTLQNKVLQYLQPLQEEQYFQ